MVGQGFTSTLDEDFERLSITVLRMKSERDRLEAMLIKFVTGFTEDPGTSDLDDEQPIHVSMTLGDYRRAIRLLHEVQS